MSPDNRYLQRKHLRRYRSVQMVVFFFTLYCVAVFSLILPLRPTVSESEKRELEKFPSFTWASFWNGDYFAGIDRWFSDTFPARETLIAWNTALQNWCGIHEHTVVGVVKPGDEIPVATKPHATDPTGSAVTTTTSSAAKPTTTTKAKPSGGNNPKDSQQLGGVLYAGNCGYEYYNFSRHQSDRYINLLNKVGDSLKGKATVYDMVVPNSMGVMLSDEYIKRNGISTSDQRQAISYMLGSMNQNVKTVDLFDTLREHWKEYIYFRTDHHWTATGAYYAYTQFAAEKGFKPTPLSEYEKKEYTGFLGTFYANGGKPATLGKTPDTVVTYTPKTNNDMQITDRDGKTFDWNVVMDASLYGESTKYSAFIGGDNPFSVIQNPTLTDGSSCVVVKESYGNAFVPFLTDHYQTVYVVDYRYYEGNLLDLVIENKVQDVIFVNNIMATSTESRIDDLYAVTGIME